MKKDDTSADGINLLGVNDELLNTEGALRLLKLLDYFIW
jgi:hypothetical protein